jgi:UDP-2-acetamido-2,6-beta-L-arabino-hexul-4-ose reductase
MKVLVTGSDGFIGRNLRERLERVDGLSVAGFDVASEPASLATHLGEADAIVHLAGTNRPKDSSEYMPGNLGPTSEIADALERSGRSVPILFASSIQAGLDNPYGKSKLAAEERLRAYSARASARVRVFRFANVFGKWCRPNYNSAVATFCHNISHGLPIAVNDPAAGLRLVYIDDVVEAISRELASSGGAPGFALSEAEPIYETTVGALADAIRLIHEARLSGMLPNLDEPLIKKLNSTYLSYLDPADLSLPASMKRDDRGWLFELIKSTRGGQVFVSRTKPGITRGNHYHDSKVEKFCVVGGTARISLRRIDGGDRIDFDVAGDEVRIVDIPPGYTHSLRNTGEEDCLAIFWSNEIFDPSRPDTYFKEV